MARLILKLTRVSPTHHAFDYRRADGSGERVELESKTFLFHDLLHFAVESEAKLGRSFYGMLASGMSLAEVGKAPLAGEVAVTERAVGAMTGAIKSDGAAERVVAGFRELTEALGETHPDWFDEGFVAAVRERMRRLTGEWRALPFGATMTLTFEV